ncbi:MAG: Hvo_1808 family surface protein [Halovenus sp.]
MSDGKPLLVIGLVFLMIAGIGAVDSTALSPGDHDGLSVPGEATDEQAEPTDQTEQGEEIQTLDDVVDSCAATQPDDFADPADENGVVGFVDGYWYNESIDINAADGLNETELEKLSARAAARFEAMRCLDAPEGLPSVEILTREEFQDEQSGQFESIPASESQFDNAKLETLLLVSSQNNSIDEREQNRGATIGGSYNFRENEIRIVTDDPESLRINEPVLAHELGHAVQDQQFNLSQYSRETSDMNSGILGLIEGDVSLIENRYRTACAEGLWNCVTEGGGDSGTGNGASAQEPANWGLYFTNFQPYSDGPNFIQQIFERSDGWEGVNDLYEDPPQSAFYTVNPGSYGELELGDITVPDESADQWERLTFPEEPNYDTVGIAGISAMFKTPTYETGGQVSIYRPQEILNLDEDGEVDRFNPLNYDHPETEGWRDDKLYVYTHADTNETATAWSLQWETAADAEPFVESYQQMIEYRGGQPVEGSDQTYEFGANSDYEMALTIQTDGDRVTVVKAPTVEELDEIHGVELD